MRIGARFAMNSAILILSALAEPTRLSAMHILSDEKEHCVCDLMRALDVSQSRMSRHMAVLRNAGLVVDRREAQRVCYRTVPNLPTEVATLLEAAMALSAAPNRKAA
jgi:ArsR family transcriptional regulator, arsenate/arsenite/antimonite-responsive transcriptional repressor